MFSSLQVHSVLVFYLRFTCVLPALFVIMALTASALKGRVVDQVWKRENFMRWVDDSKGASIHVVSNVEPFREKCSVLEREMDALVRERDQLRMELEESRRVVKAWQQSFNDAHYKFIADYNLLLNDKDMIVAQRDILQKDNDRLKQENESLKLKSVVKPVVAKKETSRQEYIATTAENAVPAIKETKKEMKKEKQEKSCNTSKPKVFDANNEEDIDWIMGTCCQAVEKCKLSNSYVNKNYKQIVPNNGFHDGVSNACLAISLSDGLSRIVNGRPATKQETNDMIKALGCKGMMKDFYDLDVVVAIYNKICVPHGINVQLFERKAKGRHVFNGCIAHSPNASSSDPCIVLSWIRDAHFELMLK